MAWLPASSASVSSLEEEETLINHNLKDTVVSASLTCPCPSFSFWWSSISASCSPLSRSSCHGPCAGHPPLHPSPRGRTLEHCGVHAAHFLLCRMVLCVLDVNVSMSIETKNVETCERVQMLSKNVARPRKKQSVWVKNYRVAKKLPYMFNRSYFTTPFKKMYVML